MAPTHPKAKRLRTAGCSTYEKQVTIFGGTQDVADSDDNNEETSFCLNPQTSDVHEEREEGTSHQINRGCAASPTSSGARHVRSQSWTSKMLDAIRSLAKASYPRTNVLSQQQSGGVGSSSEHYSMATCIKVLEGIQDVDMPTYLKAIEKLQSKVWRETFIEMSALRRIGWLASL
ncbi:unnamed protein product [Ilex paraguariensis]|uniref:Uncharacterized protein n=1 Tax=Ilex paraguariensis TaxID=185542 RepID=A0ABC8RVU4_9AQUA